MPSPFTLMMFHFSVVATSNLFLVLLIHDAVDYLVSNDFFLFDNLYYFSLSVYYLLTLI